ncbi:phosphatidate cytidylyltransferase [Flavobacterium sp.]|uniref:phosphatidate cytidylyltransferase n=1 Tax=Flavobacterium sp. TaxID=239 RepID=UPI00352971F9
MNETLKRAISGAVYVVLLISCIYYSYDSFFILFGLFLALAAYEFSKLVNLNKWFALLAAISLYSFFYNSKYYLVYDKFITGFTISVSLLLVYFLFSKKPTIPFSNYLKYVALLGYIIFPFIIITKVPIGDKGYNPKILISIFILIWTNDTFAYLVGKNIGKHKLLPSISPKKTIEGFVGGLFFTIISGYLLAKNYINIRESNLYMWLIIAVIVSIFSTLGDLIESKFKRMAGVKDSGNIMPGHGGILDRLDSIIFVVPFIYLFYLILYYVS